MLKKLVIAAIFLFFLFLIFMKSFSDFTTQEICVIYTTDVNGNIKQYQYLAGTIKSLRESCEGDSILIDNGGFFKGRNLELFLSKKTDILDPASRFIKEMKYNFINIDSGDFILGRNNLLNFIKTTGAKVVTLNMSGLGKEESVVVNGVKIGVAGLVPPLERTYLPDEFFEGIDLQNPIHKFEQKALLLKKATDTIIAPIYSGTGESFFEYNAEESDFLLYLYRSFPFIKLLLGGRTGEVKEKKLSDDSYMIQAGKDGLFLGFARLTFIKKAKGNKNFLISVETKLVPADIPDKEMEKVFLPYIEFIKRVEKEKAAKLSFNFSTLNKKSGETVFERIIHYELHQILADYGLEADFSLILLDLPEIDFPKDGEMRVEDISGIYPYDDFPAIVALTGRAIITYLEENRGKNEKRRASIYPAEYTIENSKIIFKGIDLFPEQIYMVAVPSRILPEFEKMEPGEYKLKKIVPEKISTYLLKHFPEAFEKPFSPMWIITTKK